MEVPHRCLIEPERVHDVYQILVDIPMFIITNMICNQAWYLSKGYFWLFFIAFQSFSSNPLSSTKLKEIHSFFGHPLISGNF